MDFAHPATDDTYTRLWLQAVWRQLRSEKHRTEWLEAAQAWRTVMRYAIALGNELDERVFRGLAEEAEAAAMIAEVVGR